MKILKMIVLSPVFTIGTILMIIGAIGVYTLRIGEKIMKKIGAL